MKQLFVGHRVVVLSFIQMAGIVRESVGGACITNFSFFFCFVFMYAFFDF